jgi:hypothetical protein
MAFRRIVDVSTRYAAYEDLQFVISSWSADKRARMRDEIGRLGMGGTGFARDWKVRYTLMDPARATRFAIPPESVSAE